MDQEDIRALKFFGEDFLKAHKKIGIIIKEINCAFGSFIFSRLFRKLNLNEFKELLERRSQLLKEQKL